MSETDRRYCENCGREISQTANFCPTCGEAQQPEAPQQPEAQEQPERVEPTVPPPSTPAQPPQRHIIRNILIVLVSLIVLIILVRACGGGGGSSSSKGGSTTATKEDAQKTPAATKQEAQSTEDPNPHFGDGTHRVGQDIQPGTYRTKKASPGCYYVRLSGFSGAFSEIIANDNVDEPAVVTIEPTDAGFQSKRCGTWTQDLSAITTSKQSFGDGTYIVGTDINPGTHRSSGKSGCYFVRLSGFTHDFGNIIANQNTDEPAVVTIAPSDAGFQSKRCGTWTKLE